MINTIIKLTRLYIYNLQVVYIQYSNLRKKIYNAWININCNILNDSWFHGKITRTKSEDVLRQQTQDGAFLVRESESSQAQGKVKHNIKIFAYLFQHFRTLLVVLHCVLQAELFQ